MNLQVMYALMLATWLLSLYRYPLLDTAGRYLSLFIGCAFLTEIFARAGLVFMRHNLYLYNVSFFYQMPLLCLYFNYSIGAFRKHHIGFWLAGLEVLLILLNMIYVEPIFIFNKNSVVMHSVLVIFMALYNLLELMRDDSGRHLRHTPTFWIAIVLAVHWLTAFMNFSLLIYLEVRVVELMKYWVPFVNFCNTTAYLALFLIFLFIPKMNKAAHANQ